MSPRSSTTFAPAWLSGKTTVIRVPEVLAEAMLEHAKYLDKSLYGVETSGKSSLKEEPKPMPSLKRPVNVASVVQRSPFRYPGGKTWLVPFLRGWLLSLDAKPSVFAEPFAGGAIAGLTVAFESLAEHVILAETDEGVASVWRTILAGQGEWLANRILNFDLTEKNVKAALADEELREHLPLKHRAFLTILRNRVQRGGIMAAGAGLVKRGENNKGIASRWYPATLARRIREIGNVRQDISFYGGDGGDLIRDYGADKTVAFYVDPPYTKAARRLYRHWEVDHAGLFREIAGAKGDFIMSYDNTPEVRELAEKWRFEYRTVTMKNTHHAKMTELLIGRNLEWLSAKSAAADLS